MHRDFISEGNGLKNECLDYVIMANILHGDEPEILLKETHRVLKHNGRLVVIH
ncbi:MAG: methyltransferase domain-containing protein [Methanohalobium sp.]|uniref:methyltransferase domain-containing protein n=1 Tax=Methanohalobium sp. TaxID=2837493 RepID=UPI00397BC73D